MSARARRRRSLGRLLLVASSLAPASAAVPAEGAQPWSLELRAGLLGAFADDRPLSRGSFDGAERLDSSDGGEGPSPAFGLRLSRGHWRLEVQRWRDSGGASASSEEQVLDPVFGPSGDYWTGAFDFAWRHEMSRSAALTSLALTRSFPFRSRERDRWSWFASAAVRRVDDELRLLSEDAPPGEAHASKGLYAIGLHEELVGLEAGLAFARELSPAWSFELELGLGVHFVRARRSCLLENDGRTLLREHARVSGLGASGRLEADLVWSSRKRLFARLGIAVGVLDGVATAPGLVARENTAEAFARAEPDGRLVLAGLAAGVGWRW